MIIIQWFIYNDFPLNLDSSIFKRCLTGQKPYMCLRTVLCFLLFFCFLQSNQHFMGDLFKKLNYHFTHNCCRYRVCCYQNINAYNVFSCEVIRRHHLIINFSTLIQGTICLLIFTRDFEHYRRFHSIRIFLSDFLNSIDISFLF